MTSKRPSPELVAVVKNLIAEHGVGRAARKLGIADATCCRVAAGEECQRGTLALVAQSLLELGRPEAKK